MRVFVVENGVVARLLEAEAICRPIGLGGCCGAIAAMVAHGSLTPVEQTTVAGWYAFWVVDAFVAVVALIGLVRPLHKKLGIGAGDVWVSK